jgi:hypothetical protein
MRRTNVLLAGAGLAGFGLAGMGYAYQQRPLLGVGLLLAGVSIVLLFTSVQRTESTQEIQERDGNTPWTRWIFVGAILLLGLIGLLYKVGVLY